jgi:hypothetical protein
MLVSLTAEHVATDGSRRRLIENATAYCPPNVAAAVVAPFALMPAGLSWHSVATGSRGKLECSRRITLRLRPRNERFADKKAQIYQCRGCERAIGTGRTSNYSAGCKQNTELRHRFAPRRVNPTTPKLRRHSARRREIRPVVACPALPMRAPKPRLILAFFGPAVGRENGDYDMNWSGRRDSNPRPQPWQGCALPLSYARAPRGPPFRRRRGL